MLQNFCSKHEFSKFDTLHDDIYVPNRKRNFWYISLQNLSGYRKWMKNIPVVKKMKNANTSLCRVQQDKIHCISNKYVVIQCLLLHQKPIVVWGWFFNYTIYISIEKAFVSPCLLKDKMYCTRFIAIINHCKELPHI